MSVEEYLASIDWLGAVIVAAVLVALGLVILRFLLATTAEVGHMLPGAGEAAGRALLDARGELPMGGWVCEVCRSVNTPAASHCYRGCGERSQVAERLPEDPDATIAGANGRRL